LDLWCGTQVDWKDGPPVQGEIEKNRGKKRQYRFYDAAVDFFEPMPTDHHGKEENIFQELRKNDWHPNMPDHRWTDEEHDFCAKNLPGCRKPMSNIWKGRRPPARDYRCLTELADSIPAYRKGSKQLFYPAWIIFRRKNRIASSEFYDSTEYDSWKYRKVGEIRIYWNRREVNNLSKIRGWYPFKNHREGGKC